MSGRGSADGDLFGISSTPINSLGVPSPRGHRATSRDDARVGTQIESLSPIVLCSSASTHKVLRKNLLCCDRIPSKASPLKRYLKRCAFLMQHLLTMSAGEIVGYSTGLLRGLCSRRFLRSGHQDNLPLSLPSFCTAFLPSSSKSHRINPNAKQAQRGTHHSVAQSSCGVHG